MRQPFSGRTGTVLAFVLGLVIATAGTAGAARLITGKQIKDGSIGTRDLNKAVRGKLAKAGTPGPKGEQGPVGPAGTPDGYTRAEADGRFLQGTGAAASVVLQQTVGSPTRLLVVPGLGDIKVECLGNVPGGALATSFTSTSAQPLRILDRSDRDGQSPSVQSVSLANGETVPDSGGSVPVRRDLHVVRNAGTGAQNASIEISGAADGPQGPCWFSARYVSNGG